MSFSFKSALIQWPNNVIQSTMFLEKPENISASKEPATEMAELNDV